MQAEHLPHVQRSWGRKKPDMINDEKKNRKDGEKHRKDGEKHRKHGLLSKRAGSGRAGIGHGKELGFDFILNEVLGFQRALRREMFCKLSSGFCMETGHSGQGASTLSAVSCRIPGIWTKAEGARMQDPFVSEWEGQKGPLRPLAGAASGWRTAGNTGLLSWGVQGAGRKRKMLKPSPCKKFPPRFPWSGISSGHQQGQEEAGKWETGSSCALDVGVEPRGRFSRAEGGGGRLGLVPKGQQNGWTFSFCFEQSKLGLQLT